MPERENDRLELWEAKDGYRWRRWSDNGNILSESGGGYENEDYIRGLAEELNPGVPWGTAEEMRAPKAGIATKDEDEETGDEPLSQRIDEQEEQNGKSTS